MTLEPAQLLREHADLLLRWGPPLLVLLAIGRPLGWRLLRTVVTIAHEGGHAAVAVLVGRRLTGIRVHSDTSGVTVSRGRPDGPGMVATAAAGYPAAGLLGLALAALLDQELLLPALWATLLLLALLLIQVRNAFGLLAVAISAAAVFAALWWGRPPVQAAFGSALAWLLLLGGMRAAVELQRARSRARRGSGGLSSDADQLAQLTGVPALCWVAGFQLLCLTTLVCGGWLLLGRPVL